MNGQTDKGLRELDIIIFLYSVIVKMHASVIVYMCMYCCALLYVFGAFILTVMFAMLIFPFTKL